MDILNDLFKPVLLLLVGALSYFIKKEFSEIKETIRKINTTLEDFPNKYVEQRDCDRTLLECREIRKEHKLGCEATMKEMKNVVSDLVTCVNKRLDDCDVKAP